jgi:hypothetical protein
MGAGTYNGFSEAFELIHTKTGAYQPSASTYVAESHNILAASAVHGGFTPHPG